MSYNFFCTVFLLIFVQSFLFFLDNMQEKQELQKFIKNIQLSLKRFTLQELNEVWETALEKESNLEFEKNNRKNIELAIGIICAKYKITRHVLIYGKSRKDLQYARTIAYCILHFTINLSIRYIAKRVFFLNWHNSVTVAIKSYNQLNLSLPQDLAFKKDIELVESKLLKELKK